MLTHRIPNSDLRFNSQIIFEIQYFTKVQATVALLPALTQCNCVKNRFRDLLNLHLKAEVFKNKTMEYSTVLFSKFTPASQTGRAKTPKGG
jgi:hypothetical protein